MRHIISILLQNESGALARAAGMFAARGYNIESLTVAPTQDPMLSRITLVTTGSDSVIDQIVKQSRKLIDVVEVRDLTGSDHTECELLLIKLRISPDALDAVEDALRQRSGKRVDASGAVHSLQFAGTGAEIDDALAAMAAIADIVEVVRSGVVAIESGTEALGAEILHSAEA